VPKKGRRSVNLHPLRGPKIHLGARRSLTGARGEGSWVGAVTGEGAKTRVQGLASIQEAVKKKGGQKKGNVCAGKRKVYVSTIPRVNERFSPAHRQKGKDRTGVREEERGVRKKQGKAPEKESYSKLGTKT